MSAIKPLRIELRVRNNALIERREALGMTQKEVAEAAGVSLHDYQRYEQIKLSPLRKVARGNYRREPSIFSVWRDSAVRTAAFFDASPEELWPEVTLKIQRTKAIMTANAEDLPAAMGISQPPELPSSALESEELRSQTRRILSTLTPLEEKVLRHRFGIGVTSDHTLDEVGEAFVGPNGGKLTRERVRQIEAKALRKLRHPSRSKRLKAFVEDP